MLRSGRTSMSGWSRSTRNWESPVCRSAGVPSVRASRTIAWATWAPVVQTLVPLSVHEPSGCSVALVRTAARSEPASGSLMPMAKNSVPAAIPGR
ncbi:Uncharacterised protein [Mycobacteroides abscessus subsp. abscessus]|nr:Uncharacterised protein [Mycobacteroides abscessus subsp. abscessus]